MNEVLEIKGLPQVSQFSRPRENYFIPQRKWSNSSSMQVKAKHAGAISIECVMTSMNQKERMTVEIASLLAWRQRRGISVLWKWMDLRTEIHTLGSPFLLPVQPERFHNHQMIPIPAFEVHTVVMNTLGSCRLGIKALPTLLHRYSLSSHICLDFTHIYPQGLS